MPKRKPFPCNGCGGCCRKIASAVAFAKQSGFPDEVCNFPYKWNQQGVCEMLAPGNRCKVYERRPLLCNVEEMYPHIVEYFMRETGQPIDHDTYIEYNTQACKTL
jgi:Fe-S-cluster containining protein